ncbi:sensor histidine kinase [Nocardioides daphniae]|uniref:histidine kinase n=1 Tax=Nocardioides daphniae TaxID=402297 RepID=A0A4P7U865_9ACTN|nr:ATP-binding protein [Nocardioides daphniae]QCC76332.1 hypothetical protein E2C04_02315 [Nocardioides daphniae]GGD07829.1 hypothetical protein GCM10007231_03220 [Nocardioides daphniae]
MPVRSIDAAVVDTLDSILAGVTDLMGFEVATISVAHVDGVLETVAVAGSDEAKSALRGHRVEVDLVHAELVDAEEWGPWRFVPHDRLKLDAERFAWISSEVEATDDPTRWHPLDVLVAPLYDGGGRLRALISVDSPENRMRPTQAVREDLASFVEQTRPAVLNLIERSELAAQVRLADAARLVVRQASSELSIERIIEVIQSAVTRCFDAFGMWIQTFDEGGDGQGAIHASNGAEIRLSEDLRRIARPAARMMWASQDVAAIGRSSITPDILTDAQREQIYSFMKTIDVTSMLFIPLGAGKECLGNLVLTRHGELRTEWSEVERRVALDIGHDLGRALLNARSFERERQLVAELRELNSYKSNLIATLSHELKNPLTAILGHTEMLEASPELTPSARNSIAAVERGAARMQRLVDDLLVLARAGDPHAAFDPSPIDLHAAVLDAVDLMRVTINRKELDVVVDAPDESLKVLAESDGIDRIVSNLVSNAIKYTPEGGRVTVSLRALKRQVRLDVVDSGIGISRRDQEQLFSEFFRSTNPAAVALPGTGLGLAIVKSIVERHDGRITCESTLGKGTTFSVLLPRA